MKRGNHRRTKHEVKYTILCDWCGGIRETAREDTKTCSDKCRSRLSAFFGRFGYEPRDTPGPVTASVAAAAEIDRLISEERQRRINARIDLLGARAARKG